MVDIGDRGRDHGRGHGARERLVHDERLLGGAMPRDLDVRRLGRHLEPPAMCLRPIYMHNIHVKHVFSKENAICFHPK